MRDIIDEYMVMLLGEKKKKTKRVKKKASIWNIYPMYVWHDDNNSDGGDNSSDGGE